MARKHCAYLLSPTHGLLTVERSGGGVQWVVKGRLIFNLSRRSFAILLLKAACENSKLNDRVTRYKGR